MREVLEKELNNPKRKIIIAILLSILSFVMTTSAFVVANSLNDKIYNNIFVDGYNISNMSFEEANIFLNGKLSNPDNLTIKVINEDGKEYIEFKGEQIGLQYDVSGTVNLAYEYGRTKNILKNNIVIAKNIVIPKIIPMQISYNREKLDAIIGEIENKIENRKIDDTYNVDIANKVLTITRGKKGFEIDREKTIDSIITNIGNNISDNQKLVRLYLIEKEAIAVKADEIYSEIVKVAQDAQIKDKPDGTKEFIKEENGVDFNLDEAIKILSDDNNKNEGQIINIPITVTIPNIKLEYLTRKLYQDVLATYTTYFPTSTYDRGENLRIGSSTINNQIVMPGETFSTIKRINSVGGYKLAPVYSEGKLEMGYAGGICQVSTTLYNSVLRANLGIVERKAHSMPVSYVPYGLDATMSTGYVDFRFKNTRSYPIKIVAEYSWGSKSLTIKILGTKESTEYVVSVYSVVNSKTNANVRYVYDNTIDEGVQKVKTNGINGGTATSYRVLKLNGKEVSREILGKDVYKTSDKIIIVGTKKAQTVVTDTPQGNNSNVDSGAQDQGVTPPANPESIQEPQV